MSGFQFVHLQAFSRKAVAGKAGSDGVTRGGRAGVRDVMAEAGREPGAALHVDQPRPPVLVHGLDPAGVERLHDARVEAGRCEVAGGKLRKIRVDQATLLTVVASYPGTVSACEADPATAAARDAWQARNVAWLRAEFGERLAGVVRHDDEAHPHLHAYILPDDAAMKANPLHPGWAAKAAAKEVAEADGLDPKAANAAGDRAYKTAMRAVQDRYWEAVGLPSGLARVGPARRRLTRDAWQAEQAQAAAAGVMLSAVAVAQVEVETATSRAAFLVEQGAAYVAAAWAAAEKAKGEADAARRAEAQARAAAARLIAAARREAAATVAAAEVRAGKARRIGAVLGGLWSGFAGVRRRLEAGADRRVGEVHAKAKVAVAGARRAAVSAVGGDLVNARQAAADAVRRAESAEAALKAAGSSVRKAEAETERERAARRSAESERERFRGLYADADNARIAMQRGSRLG